MANPKITVLMSVYNGEKHLREAMESILRQTFKDFEFLITNDGSTDGTAKILRSYQDSRIKVIDNKKNIGLTKSLNKGLKLAKGKYIARMDADDLSLPGRLEEQFDFLEKNPDVGLVSSWTQLIDEKGKKLGSWEVKYSPEEIYYLLNFRNCLSHSSVMFRKELVLKLGGYSGKMALAQDYQLWYRLSKVAKIAQIPKKLILLRRTKENVSSKLEEQQREAVEMLVRKNLENLLGDRLTKEEVAVLQTAEIPPARWSRSRPPWRWDGLKAKAMTPRRWARMITTLNKINQNLLEKEKNIITKLGLDKRRLKEVMDKEIFNFVYLYRQRSSLIDLIILLFSLNPWLTWRLVGCYLRRTLRE